MWTEQGGEARRSRQMEQGGDGVGIGGRGGRREAHGRWRKDRPRRPATSPMRHQFRGSRRCAASGPVATLSLLLCVRHSSTFSSFSQTANDRGHTGGMGASLAVGRFAGEREGSSAVEHLLRM
ncbi:hypothetical protein BS78_10G161100 [Paspalum vaginatum]|nr:hypothetical protein BS78_10G161100 [Paspalum vaginatum]KAJ1259504.1 hypothetical protein BS78_10G161100 [Paspalum vaginatum]KAJ1259505.1 hypothetical protein BS78_10G161100 [Paspalum vaginatum]